VRRAKIGRKKHDILKYDGAKYVHQDFTYHFVKRAVEFEARTRPQLGHGRLGDQGRNARSGPGPNDPASGWISRSARLPRAERAPHV
jgi:hypothetical protein